MKILLILFGISFTSGEKLSRGYLPPPGAHLAGGDFNHNDLPFDLPKEVFQTNTDNVKSAAYTTPEVGSENLKMGSKEIVTPTIYDIYYNTPSITTLYTKTDPSDLEYSTTPSSQIFNNFDVNNGNNDAEINVTDPDLTNNQIQDEVINNSVHVTSNQPFEIYTKQPASTTNFSEANGNTGDENINEFNKAMDLFNEVTTDPSIPDDTPTEKSNYSTVQANYDLVSSTQNDLKDITYSPVITTDVSYSEESSSSYPERLQSVYDRNAVTTDQKNIIKPESFSYSFDTSNGLHTDVTGTGHRGVQSKGSFSYVGDDGKFYKMEYIADENGFQPRGDHLPTAPPIPIEIQKVIEQAYKDKAAGISDDGSYSEEKYGYKKYTPLYENKIHMPYFINKKDDINNNNNYISANREKGNNREEKDERPNMITDQIINNGVTEMRGSVEVAKHVFQKDSEDLNDENANMISDIIQNGYEYLPPKNSTDFEGKDSTIENDENLNNEEMITKSYNIPGRELDNFTEKISTQEPFTEYDDKTNTPAVSENYHTEPEIFINTERFLTTTYTSDGNPATSVRPTYLLSEHLNIRNDNNPKINLNSDKNGDFRIQNNPESSTLENIQTSIIGEEFNGPKQYPSYDPNSGYYY